MAGPWFVDPENGLTTNDGLSTSTPWKLIPGQTGASSQTGYGVVAGDVINVKNGTTTSLRITPTVDNLTYRGYGVASNVLVLTLPKQDPAQLKTVRVVREAGTHEGMWIIDHTAINGSAIGATSTTGANGVTFEDVCIIGPGNGTHNAIQYGTSSATTLSGFTIRRFLISKSSNRGMSMYCANFTAELGRIEYTKDDNITIFATTSNSNRAGSVDSISDLQLVEPNLEAPGAEATGTGGDFFQYAPNSGGLQGSSLTAKRIYGHKTTEPKQGMVLHVSGGASIWLSNLHFSGGGNMQVLIGHVDGTVTVEDSYFKDWAVSENFLFRFDPADTSPPSYAWTTDSVVTLKNIVADGVCPGFASCVYTAGSYSFDGSLIVNNCTASGTNTSTLGYASSVAFWSSASQSTFGTNFVASLKNNSVQTTGKPHVILPTGSANSAKWVLSGNCFVDSTYEIGSTEYADLSAFEAAHSYATGNTDADPLLSDGYRPLPGSPLLNSGADLGYVRDIEKKQGRKFIGAYGAAALRVWP